MALQQTLLDPVPDFSTCRIRKAKARFSDVTLDLTHFLANDPIVRLIDYGVRGISYYAQCTWMQELGGLPQALNEVLVRQDIAERLAHINNYLDTTSASYVHDILNGEVELFVTDALRPLSLIRTLYNEVYPKFLRLDNPSWTNEQINAERDRRVSKPIPEAPHASGGAIDVVLSYKSTGQKVPNGVIREIPATVQPEYYENVVRQRSLSKDELLALHSRRILFNLMTRSRSKRGGESFVCNGLEIWHYGTGDRLSAFVADRPAYYGPASIAL